MPDDNKQDLVVMLTWRAQSATYLDIERNAIVIDESIYDFYLTSFSCHMYWLKVTLYVINMHSISNH